MYSKWLLSKDNGVAHPKHESISSGKEYETSDLESKSTRLEKKCTFKELKTLLFLRIINR